MGRMMPQMMRSMAHQQVENMMPRMMDACFSSMDAQRREVMLTHCRSMLDQMEDRYLKAPLN